MLAFAPRFTTGAAARAVKGRVEDKEAFMPVPSKNLEP